MKIILPATSCLYEKRVPLTPENVAVLVKSGASVFLDSALEPLFPLFEYERKGAVICGRDDLCQGADLAVVMDVLDPVDLDPFPEGMSIVGALSDASEMVQAYRDRGLQAFSLKRLPRTSRAQFMDVLSSQANLLGYWSVIKAASHLTRVLPMMTTAAGTLPAARVLILGAGVAGLQAIATAKRLGARVDAFDVRLAAKQEVESLGARFLQMPEFEDAQGTGGYARALSDQEQARQKEFLEKALPDYDVIICSALVPGRKPPVLIHYGAVLKTGAVVVDLAAGALDRKEEPGNCAFSKAGFDTKYGEALVIGAFYSLSHLAASASVLYGKNMVAFLELLWDGTEMRQAHEDDLLAATCLTKLFETKEQYSQE